MNIFGLYKRISLCSPYLEIILRFIYWRCIKPLNRCGSSKKYRFQNHPHSFNLGNVISWIQENGVKKGSLLIFHSSFDSIAGRGINPIDIIHELRILIGNEGTLAMPVIRRYKNYPIPSKWLSADFSNLLCTYNPKKTPITSGLIPSLFIREKDVVVSLHPLNTLAAVGPLAQPMMEHNIDGEAPTPHGPNSSWKFCADHDAFVVAFGVNIVHHLTIAHVAEDNFDWPYNNWYNDIMFDIVMPDNSIIRKVVRERKPKWGLLHDAELNMEKDLFKEGLIKTAYFDGVPVSIIQSSELISFLKSRKHKGYPYYKFF